MMKNTFDLLFYICLAGAVVLFITALIMFFAMDIHGIFNIKTGRAARKTIKQMEAENQTTGRLRTAKKKKTGSITQAITHEMPQTTSPTQAPTVTQPSRTTGKPSQAPTATQAAAARRMSEPDSEEQTSLLDTASQTELLDKEMVADSGETELLSDTAAAEPQYTETVVLSGVAPQTGGYTAIDAGAEEEGLTQPLNRVSMNIIKKMVFRDTDEIIA